LHFEKIGGYYTLNSHGKPSMASDGASYCPCDYRKDKLRNRYPMAVMPGTTTLKDAVTALECGADAVKTVVAMKAIKAIHFPLPRAPAHVDEQR